MPVVEKKGNYETILLEGEQIAPVTTRADLATNLGAQSLISAGQTVTHWSDRWSRVDQLGTRALTATRFVCA